MSEAVNAQKGYRAIIFIAIMRMKVDADVSVEVAK
jgi:hypothetical protein